jgi:hypothetical protein
MILLFSIGPVMHSWLRERGRPVPMRCYAGLNLCSIAVVVLYPFTIERAIGLQDQIFLWRGFLWILVWLLGAAAVGYLRSEPSAPVVAETNEPISYRRAAIWLGLSALLSLGMLGATCHLTAEIGSSSLAWVGPFGVYLLSFVLTSSAWWQPRYTTICLGWLAVSLAGFMVVKGVSNLPVNHAAAFWLLSLTAAASFFGNGLIHQQRGNARLEFFHLVMAAGSLLGGVLAVYAAPLLFLRPSEILAVSCGLLVVGVLPLIARRDVLSIAVVILIVTAPVVGLAWRQTQDEAAGVTRVRRFRNLYGFLALRSQENGLVLSSGTTARFATQITTNPESRRHPTLFLTESTGVGRVIEETQKARPSLHMGVVGLGAGTLAAYARPADSIDFWEIDPNAIRIARDYFTFLADSAGRVQLKQTDGRMGLAASSADYDVIVIDPTSGDGIPSHLLTREAFSTYFSRLDQRRGLLAIHATSRYQELFPVVGATAHILGWSCLEVRTEISSPTDARDWDGTDSRYILFCHPDQLRQVADWLPAQEDKGRVKRTLTVYDPTPPGEAVVWTDNRHAELDVLDLRRFLFGE